MTDFTTLKLQGNTGVSDASTTWTDVLFGTAGYELRAALSGGGATTTTPSASWPSMLKPASGVTLVNQMWAFSADTTGLQINTYDGTTAHYNQFRISWDNLGTFASAPLISAWASSALPAASPGTQPGTGDGTSIVNGTAGESGSLSLLKANAYGYGVDTAGVQQTPAANAAGTETVNGHSGAGGVSPGTGAWLATWQDLQAATDWIVDAVIPKATTAGYWYFVTILRIAFGMTGGTLLPVLGFQYTWI